MRQFVIHSLAAAAIGAALAFASAPAFAKTVAECNTEYAANKAAIRASKQTKKDFVAACRAGTETIPTSAAPGAPAPAPVTAPASAPAAPAPVAPSPHVGATGAGQFTTDAQARARCPSDTVVWVNTKSNVYHFAGRRDYGNTKQGSYMCEADAKAAGDRAAKNEKHP